MVMVPGNASVCPECKAVVLDGDARDHYWWHAKNKAASS